MHRPESLPELPWREYGNVLDLVQLQQLLVTGDQHAGSTRDRGAQHEPISLVAQLDVREAGRLGEYSVLFQETDELRGQFLVRDQLGPHHGSDLNQYLIADDQLVGNQYFAQDVRAKPARRYRADQNIGVGEDPHDTASKTSSSVR